MTHAIELDSVSRRIGAVRALDDVSLTIEPQTIVGLLGRNGAGKTTLMSLVSGQDRPTSGEIRVFGHSPYENAKTLAQMCFIRDNQRYPDDYRLHHVLRVAPAFYPNWDAAYAERLVGEFRIPRKQLIKKFSRGQLSAVAIVIGLAARAPLTFFDEPYLGLDATARQAFYDHLLRDQSEHPRTIVLSTHLIDEMEPLLERVVVLDAGRVVLDSTVDEARGRAVTVTGLTASVDAFTGTRRVLRSHGIGGLKTVTLDGSIDAGARREAAELGLDLGTVTLQDLVAAYGAAERETEGIPA